MNEHMDTPWGPTNDVETIGPGVIRIDTPSHGGYRLTAVALARMPDALRAMEPFAGPGWYEEDCDWALVALSFPDLFPPRAVRGAVQTAGMRAMSSWSDEAIAWLKTPEAARVHEIVAAYEAEHGEEYEQGSSGYGPGGLVVWWTRVKDGHRLFINYGKEGNYTDLPDSPATLEAISARSKSIEDHTEPARA